MEDHVSSARFATMVISQKEWTFAHASSAAPGNRAIDQDPTEFVIAPHLACEQVQPRATNETPAR